MGFPLEEKKRMTSFIFFPLAVPPYMKNFTTLLCFITRMLRDIRLEKGMFRDGFKASIRDHTSVAAPRNTDRGMNKSGQCK